MLSVSDLVCVYSGRRGGGGARGRGRGQSSALPSREQLDAELDAYNSKVHLSICWLTLVHSSSNVTMCLQFSDVVEAGAELLRQWKLGTRRDQGRGSNPAAETRQMETEAWQIEIWEKQNVLET